MGGVEVSDQPPVFVAPGVLSVSGGVIAALNLLQVRISMLAYLLYYPQRMDVKPIVGWIIDS
ncbi:hypothetical protein [Streptomyces odonnellii]|uniref:hypothetical protein n=1 Tax=Streptomyces odonnellii TaxID=1417980 RepID=UPI000A92CAFE|nr:hypothetical protein [Streptomyces odonnellii]